MDRGILFISIANTSMPTLGQAIPKILPHRHDRAKTSVRLKEKLGSEIQTSRIQMIFSFIHASHITKTHIAKTAKGSASANKEEGSNLTLKTPPANGISLWLLFDCYQTGVSV